MTTQTELHRIANQLEDIVKLLRKPGIEAFELAQHWAGVGAAAAATDGSRSTGINDIGEKIIEGTEENGRLRIPAEFVFAHQRMTTDLAALKKLTLLADLTFCQRAVRTKREQANSLDRTNSKSGECETCYQAGRLDSYQRGTLEAVILPGFVTDPDGEIVHDQLDLCRNCAKSAHGSRAGARSSGTDWDHEEWTTARIARLKQDPSSPIRNEMVA